MGKLDELWSKTVFDESDVGEKYCEMIIREGTSAPLLDLPDDAPLPSYFDRNLFKKAQDYYQKYTVFISTTNVLGVMILFGVESILDILVCTQQSSTPVTAFKRYTETLLYIDNIFADSPEDPLSKCSKSILAVRKKHKHGSSVGLRRTNKFINQRDMAITQNSFLGHVLVYHNQFGMQFEPEEMHALCHFWRVIGYMLGIDDQYNLCAGDLATVQSRCLAIFRHIIVPGLLHAPMDFQTMTEAYFNGLLGMSTEFEPEKFIFVTKRMTQVPGYYLTEQECAEQRHYIEAYPHYIPNAMQLKEEMSRHPKISKSFGPLKWTHRWDILFTDYLLVNVVPKYSLVRRLFNFIHTTRMFFLRHLPLLAMYRFGYKNAYVRVLKD